MASAVQSLTIRMVDQMSGPAKSAANSLNQLANAGKATQGLRSTRRELTGLARDLQVLQQRADAVGNFQGMLRGLADVRQRFNQAQAEVKKTSQALREARQRLSDLQQVKPFGRGVIAKELRGNLQQAQRDVRRLESAYTRAQREVKDTSSAFNAQKTALVNLRSEMGRMGQPVTNLRQQQKQLQDQIERTSKALNQQNSTRLPAGSQQRAPTGGGAAGGGGVRPGLAVGSDLAMAAGSTYALFRGFMTIHDFQDELNRAQQKGALGAENRARIEAEARRIGVTTPFTATQGLEMLRTYLAAGQNATQSIGMAAPTLKFALAGDISPEMAAQGVVSVAKQYRMPMETLEESEATANRIGNVVQAIANNTQGTVGDALAAFKYVAMFANRVGIDMDELGAYTAQMISAGLRGDEVGIALRSMLTRMVRPTLDASAQLAELGLSMDDFTKSRRPLNVEEFAVGMKHQGYNIDHLLPRLQEGTAGINMTDDGAAIRDFLISEVISGTGATRQVDQNKIAGAINKYVNSAAQELDVMAMVEALTERGVAQGQIARLFDVRQGSRLTGLFGEDEMADIERYRAIMQSSDGAIDEAFNIRMQGLPGQLKLFVSAWENLLLAMGDAGVIEDATNALRVLTGAVRYLAAEHPNLLKTVTYILAGAAALGMLVIPLQAIYGVAMGLAGLAGIKGAAGAAGAAAGAARAGKAGSRAFGPPTPRRFIPVGSGLSMFGQVGLVAAGGLALWDRAGRDEQVQASFRRGEVGPNAGRSLSDAFGITAAQQAAAGQTSTPASSAVDMGAGMSFGAFPLSRDYSDSGRQTGGSFSQAMMQELQGLEAEVDALVSRIQQKLSFRASPVIAPQFSGAIASEARAAGRASFSDGGGP